MIARDIDYDFPSAAFFILAFLIWLGLFLALKIYRNKQLENLSSSSLLPSILYPRSDFYTWIKVGALLCAWIFACIALMEPKAHGHYIHTSQTQQIAKQPPRTILFLVDASASMEIRDTRLKISRLDIAKEIADTIISQLGSGANAGIYAFTSALTKLSSPTPDQLFARVMLKSIRVNEGDITGTDYLTAFKGIHNQFLNEPSDMQYTLIILSDGGDTTVESSEGPQKEAAIKAILDQLNPEQGVNFRVYTIGIGSKEGGIVPGQNVHSSLNEGLLQKISQAGHGKSYLSNAYTPLSLAQELTRTLLQSPYTSQVIAPASSEASAASVENDAAAPLKQRAA